MASSREHAYVHPGLLFELSIYAFISQEVEQYQVHNGTHLIKMESLTPHFAYVVAYLGQEARRADQIIESLRITVQHVSAMPRAGRIAATPSDLLPHILTTDK